MLGHVKQAHHDSRVQSLQIRSHLVRGELFLVRYVEIEVPGYGVRNGLDVVHLLREVSADPYF